MNTVDLRVQLPVHPIKRYVNRKLTDIRSIAIHHSFTESGSVEAFARFHVQFNDWPGIGYTYVIDRNGIVYLCWDWTIVSYHVGDHNKEALGICLVGDFRTQQPKPEQYAAALELIRMLQVAIPSVKSVRGHSEYPGYGWKGCPVIDMDRFREGLENREKLTEENIMQG